MSEQATVYVVDDDDVVRDSLVALLEEAGYRVLAFPSAEELLRVGDATEAACVVSDVRMPGMDGLTLLRRLQTRKSSPALVLISGHGDVPLAVAAIKAGAVDFLEKPFKAEALLAAVDAGLRQLRRGNDGRNANGALRHLEALTERENEVLARLVAGELNKATAAKLGLSPRTVEFHRANIMAKTGAKGLPDLVRLWLATQPHA